MSASNNTTVTGDCYPLFNDDTKCVSCFFDNGCENCTDGGGAGFCIQCAGYHPRDQDCHCNHLYDVLVSAWIYLTLCY